MMVFMGEKYNLENSEGTVRIPKIRIQIAITIVSSILALVLFFLIKMIFNISLSKAYLPLIAYPLNFVIIFYFFPQKFQFPFGKVPTSTFVHGIGLRRSQKLLSLVLLGFVLGSCSLGGLLLGSIMTGKFHWDSSRLEWEQVLFATVPGFWEEMFFRGILSLVLLQYTKKIRKSLILQSLIFGLLHVKGFDFWSLVDTVSVIFMGLVFSYIAYKANSLVPGIIFHFLHDAFIYLFQVPDEMLQGFWEKAIFFIGFWLMLGVGTLLTKIFTDFFRIKESSPLYYAYQEIRLEEDNLPNQPGDEKSSSREPIWIEKNS